MSDRELTLEAYTKYSSVKFHDNLEILTFNCPDFNTFKADITGLTTLREFALNKINFTSNPTLNDILRILENNTKLENVDIKINYEPEPRVKLEGRIKLPELKSLSVTSQNWEDAKYMISRICIPKTELITVNIGCSLKAIPLDDVLEYIKNVTVSFILVAIELSGVYKQAKITWGGKNGETFYFSYVSNQEVCAALAGERPAANFSWENITRLELTLDDNTPPLSPNKSVFPALTSVTIHGWQGNRKDEGIELESFFTSCISENKR